MEINNTVLLIKHDFVSRIRGSENEIEFREKSVHDKIMALLVKIKYKVIGKIIAKERSRIIIIILNGVYFFIRKYMDQKRYSRIFETTVQ